MIGKLEEGRRVTSVAAEFGINKGGCRFARLESVPNHKVQLVERLVVAARGRQLQEMTDISSCSRKEADGSQQASLLSNSLQQRGDRWSVPGDRYCEEVLLPHVRLFQGAIGADFIFMEDNSLPHRTLAVEELLESEDVTRMDWPAYSPDLNPIEHVLDALGRRIAARLHHPDNTQQLKQRLIQEWVLLPPEMLHQLVLSMRRRCEATIAVRGGHGPY
ncbi:transposable element Tcb2 transposase [Trichonephila clavipes]|nr:transposable element Tcb2 transposase [Trichonephila clavipes]